MKKIVPEEFAVVEYGKIKNLCIFRWQKNWWVKFEYGAYPLIRYVHYSENLDVKNFIYPFCTNTIRKTTLIATNNYSKIDFRKS